MKLTRLSAAIVLSLGLALLAQAQASRVHKEYDNKSKSTKVETPTLYVANTPEYFVEFQLTARYKGEQQTKPVSSVELLLFSLAKSSQYTNHETLYAITDGARWQLGSGDFLDMKGETQNGADSFYGGNQYVGMQVPFPATAKVRNKGGDVTGLHMEWAPFSLKPEQLAKLAAAQKVSLRVRDKTFELNETHLSIIRDFVAQITPQP